VADKSVKSVSDFIQTIQEKVISLRRISGSDLFVFRGEPKLFQTHGMPNVFREPNKSSLENIPYYEKNILDIFRSYGFSESLSYLELAIDAQHGGFASRLLDISFNSLVALFFAAEKSENDEYPENAAVYVYAVNDLYSPESHNVQDLYDSILDQEPTYNSRLSGYSHIFIDYVKSNKRIIAQNGGFILFPGTEYVPFPPFKTDRVVIDGAHKKRILDELASFFGITEGSIYPESNTNVGYLTKKAQHMRNDGMSAVQQQKAFIDEFENYCEYYIEQATYIMTDLNSLGKNSSGGATNKNEIHRKKEFEELLLAIEKELLSVKTTWIEYQKSPLNVQEQNSQKDKLSNESSKKFDAVMQHFEQQIESICQQYYRKSNSDSIFSIESFMKVQ
jgi:hypothetical protein